MPKARTSTATRASTSVVPRWRPADAATRGSAMSEVLPAAGQSHEGAGFAAQPRQHGSVVEELGRGVAAVVARADHGAAEARFGRRGVVPLDARAVEHAGERNCAAQPHG